MTLEDESWFYPFGWLLAAPNFFSGSGGVGIVFWAMASRATVGAVKDALERPAAARS